MWENILFVATLAAIIVNLVVFWSILRTIMNSKDSSSTMDLSEQTSKETVGVNFGPGNVFIGNLGDIAGHDIQRKVPEDQHLSEEEEGKD